VKGHTVSISYLSWNDLASQVVSTRSPPPEWKRSHPRSFCTEEQMVMICGLLPCRHRQSFRKMAGHPCSRCLQSGGRTLTKSGHLNISPVCELMKRRIPTSPTPLPQQHQRQPKCPLSKAIALANLPHPRRPSTHALTPLTPLPFIRKQYYDSYGGRSRIPSTSYFLCATDLQDGALSKSIWTSPTQRRHDSLGCIIQGSGLYTYRIATHVSWQIVRFGPRC
jgi:hypothetical protein